MANILLPLSKPSDQEEQQPPPPFLPFDVVRETLTYVPVKSLVRFRCVCRRWRNLIDHDAGFVHMHARRSPQVPVDDAPDPDFKLLRVQACVRGLLLAWDRTDERRYVANPATRRIFQLPSHPHCYYYYSAFFCYVASTDEYKVVSCTKDWETNEHRCTLLALDSPNACWKDVGIIPNPRSVKSYRPLYVEGAKACFWTWTCETSGHIDVACLDLESDSFSVIALPLPSALLLKLGENYPIGWEGCFAVAFFDDGNSKEKMVVWVLRDPRRRIWEKESICLNRGEGPLKNSDIRPDVSCKRKGSPFIWFLDMDSRRHCYYNLNTRTLSVSNYKYSKNTFQPNLASCNGMLQSTTSAPRWFHSLASKLQC